MQKKSIQGLRGLFAIGVLLSHCYFLNDSPFSAGIFEGALQKLANVSFFFIAAGFFFIQSSSTRLPLLPFLKKRLSRIYPLHLLTLLARVALLFLGGSLTLGLPLVMNALLLHTWIPSVEIATSFNTVSWFLSSLLFCYLAGYFVVRIKNEKILYLITGLLLAYKTALAILMPTDNAGYYWCYLCPLAGFGDFMLGISLATVLKKRKPSASLFLQLFSLALLAVSFLLKNYLPANYCRAFLMLPANTLLLAAFSSETKFSAAVFGNKALCFLGDVSFEIYLLHTSVISVLTGVSLFNRISQIITPFGSLALLIGLCIIAALIYQYVISFVTKLFAKKQTV